MMLFLVVDVDDCSGKVGRTNAESSIAVLPGEFSVLGEGVVNPL